MRETDLWHWKTLYMLKRKTGDTEVGRGRGVRTVTELLKIILVLRVRICWWLHHLGTGENDFEKVSY